MMGNSKLMRPLFIGGWFNREGHRMRAVFVREISDGTQSYHLWRKDGKPDRAYPNDDLDKYFLYAEVNGYLLPLEMTDFDLIRQCGFEPMVMELYGNRECRRVYFGNLHKADNRPSLQSALENERALIKKYGTDPALQSKYIYDLFDTWAQAYLKSRETCGQTFPDFSGALIVNDLTRCVELSAAYQKKRQAEEFERRTKAEAENKAFCEKENQKATQTITNAVDVIRNGGVFENTIIRIYVDKNLFEDVSLVNYLMRLYQVNIPLRTQGWVNSKLQNCKMKDGKCVGVGYLSKKKHSVSKRFFDCMDELASAIIKSSEGE